MKKYRGKGRRNFDTALHYNSLQHHGERKDADRKGGSPRYELWFPANRAQRRIAPKCPPKRRRESPGERKF